MALIRRGQSITHTLQVTCVAGGASCATSGARDGDRSEHRAFGTLFRPTTDDLVWSKVPASLRIDNAAADERNRVSKLGSNSIPCYKNAHPT